MKTRLATAHLCGLIAALLFFTAGTEAGEINALHRSDTFSVEGPEISLTTVRILGLAAH
jgi:hypothetical protein